MEAAPDDLPLDGDLRNTTLVERCSEIAVITLGFTHLLFAEDLEEQQEQKLLMKQHILLVGFLQLLIILIILMEMEKEDIMVQQMMIFLNHL